MFYFILLYYVLFYSTVARKLLDGNVLLVASAWHHTGMMIDVWDLHKMCQYMSLSHSEVDLLVCFGSLSAYITKVSLSLRPQIECRTFFFRISCSFHHLWQVVQVPNSKAGPGLTVGVMLVFWNAVVAYTRCSATHHWKYSILLFVLSIKGLNARYNTLGVHW